MHCVLNEKSLCSLWWVRYEKFAVFVVHGTLIPHIGRPWEWKWIFPFNHCITYIWTFAHNRHWYKSQVTRHCLPSQAFWTPGGHTCPEQSFSFRSDGPNINQILDWMGLHTDVNQLCRAQNLPWACCWQVTFSGPSATTNIVSEFFAWMVSSREVCSVLPTIMISSSGCAEVNQPIWRPLPMKGR